MQRRCRALQREIINWMLSFESINIKNNIMIARLLASDEEEAAKNSEIETHFIISLSLSL